MPNSDYAGIRSVSTYASITLLNRLQNNTALPSIDAQIASKGREQFICVQFSEKPSKLKLWSAQNPSARDLRYACGIRYTNELLKASVDGKDLSIMIPQTSVGWQAVFIEATYEDGFIATTRAFITPQAKFPDKAPLSNNSACQTLPNKYPLSRTSGMGTAARSPNVDIERVRRSRLSAQYAFTL